MQEIIIQKNQAGQRLDKFLKKYLPEAGSSFLYKMLRKKNITLNEKRAEGKELLCEGDVVRFFFAEDTFAKFRGTDEKKESPGREEIVSEYQKAFACIKPEVLFENEDILAVNKPAGILTQKAKPQDVSLNEWLIGHLLQEGAIDRETLDFFRPSVCNRLDRNTSGIVLCGKSLKGSQVLSELIKNRDIRKYYLTICKGALYDEQLLEGYLIKDKATNKVTVTANPPYETSLRSNSLKKAVSKADSIEEKPAYIKTYYRPLAVSSDGKYSLLEVELITGKTHQIRAHLAGIGHPLIGDHKYGDPAVNAACKKYFGLQAQLLHAHRVVFPKGGQGDMEQRIVLPEECSAPLPEQFLYILRELHMDISDVS